MTRTSLLESIDRAFAVVSCSFGNQEYGTISDERGDICVRTKPIIDAGFALNEFVVGCSVRVTTEEDLDGRREAISIYEIDGKVAPNWFTEKAVDREGTRVITKVIWRNLGELFEYRIYDSADEGRWQFKQSELSLLDARAAIGKVIVHPKPAAHGKKTNGSQNRMPA